MRVKRYLVDSMPDALEKIKTDLGKDAVILNTKQVKTGGFLGFFGKHQIEVVAAVDTRNERKESPKAELSPPAVNSYAAKKAYQQLNSENRRPAVESASGSTVLPVAEEPAGDSLQKAGSSSVGLATRTTAPALAAVEDKPDKQPGNEEFKEIVNELKDMREMFKKLLLIKQMNDEWPPSFSALRNRLIAQGVHDELVSKILQELLTQVEEPQLLEESTVFREAAKIIYAALDRTLAQPQRIPRSVKNVFFFGPTGVGKTTTIAKLAAESMLKEKRKVGFITTDTYRIAAVEQLKTYANILNVPLEVVFSPAEIEQAMERLHGCDLIFVDTAGRNYRNNEYVSGMKEFLRFGETSENYLVLSLTAKFEDMRMILDNFKDTPIEKVIFTKADETDAYGAIANVAHFYNLSLSFITTGQNVPDDIIIATPEIVTNLLLGDDTYA